MNTFGLIAQLAETRIHLPLAHIETRFRVAGGIAVIEMDQVFHQTARESLDVTYTFPLPGGAAVYRCEMIVNGRVIRAVVMEENDARRVVEEKKAAGRRTALVEMDRDNLFTLQLGNTAPGDQIVIRFAYMENLDRLGSQLSLRIPFCPGIRYIPGKPLLRMNRGLGVVDDTDQVPDASRLSPPRIAGDHPDAATLFLHGTLDESELDERTLASPTHPAIQRFQSGRIEIELSGAEHLPDRDFVLRWEETAPVEPRPHAWISEHTGADGITHRYALLQIRAPHADAIDAAASDAATDAGTHFSHDIYFLLDCSGSMRGLKWTKCAEALHAFVRELGADDRVWITCFESRYIDFAEAPLPRDAMLADSSFKNLADIGTGGGTELLPALEHIVRVRADHSAGRSARLILITDGEVGNEPEILRRLRKPDAGSLPIHTFGIDTTVNDAFLKDLARQTGGRCALMTPQDDIPAAVKKLAVTLRRPVLTGLRLEDRHLTPDDAAVLPDLHAGEVWSLPLRLQPGVALSATLTARCPDGRAWSQTYDLSRSVSDAENAAPRLVWAQHRCRHLLDADRRSEAIDLAIAHNLACRGTSFVAWDEAEKVPVAKREVYQPSLLTKVIGSAPRLASCPLAHRGRKEANFIEKAVVCYARIVPLPERSDENLVSETSWIEDSAPASPCAAPPPPSSIPDVPHSQRLTYGDGSSEEKGAAACWADGFVRFLTATLHVPEDIARQIAAILCHWAADDPTGRRLRELESWLPELAAAPDPAALLESRLAAESGFGPRLDALTLLQAALVQTPGQTSGAVR